MTHSWHCSALLERAPWICRARGSRALGGNQGRRLALTLSKEDLPWLDIVAHQPFLHSAQQTGACGDTLSSRSLSWIAMMTYDPPISLSMHGLNCSILVLSHSHYFLLRNKGAGFDATFKALASYLPPLTCQSYQTTFQTTPVRPPATRPASAARRGENLPGRSPASNPLPPSPPTPLQGFVLLTTLCLPPLRALPLGSALFTFQAWDHAGLPSAT